MLDLELPPPDNSYYQEFSMDSMPRCASNSLKVDDQASFGAYTTFLSEAYPFFIHPSFASDAAQSLSKRQLYQDPSASPSIIASQSELLSSASSISTRSVDSVTSSCIGSPNQEPWPDMHPVSSFEQSAAINGRSHFQEYLSTGIGADSLPAQDKFPNCFVGRYPYFFILVRPPGVFDFIASGRKHGIGCTS